MRACVAIVLGLSLLSAACGGVNSPSSNQTTPFTQLLVLGTPTRHTFTTSRSGEISVTLTNLTPATGNRIRLTLGSLVGSSCGIFQSLDVLRGDTLLGGRLDRGTYCVDIFDRGDLTQNHTYTITVSHP